MQPKDGGSVDESLLNLVRVFGEKLYELHIGFGAMYNLCVNSNVFSHSKFKKEVDAIANADDVKALRKLLDQLGESMEREELETFLREYKGPLQ